MTTREWNRSIDPDRMLTAAGARLSDRKLLLFACGCARQMWDHLGDASREAVPIGEQAADAATPPERDALLREALIAVGGNLAGLATLFLPAGRRVAILTRQATASLRLREWHANLNPHDPAAPQPLSSPSGVTHPGQAAVLRCVAGNPFRQVRFFPRWRTADAVALAAGIYAENAFDRLPFLADALMDAGCDNDRILAHLRDRGPHTRGCWVVDLVLNKC